VLVPVMTEADVDGEEGGGEDDDVVDDVVVMLWLVRTMPTAARTHMMT